MKPMPIARFARILACLAVLLGPAALSAAEPGNYTQREDVRQFIDEMVTRHGFSARELRKVFSKARYQPGIIRAMTPPPEAPVKSWQGYRALFVTRERIDAGARFRLRHAPILERAEREFGVPAEIIVAIIGVETVYGRNMGAHKIIDALTTLAFDFPRRGEYFRSELENFLLYARETGTDVLGAQGSYAGAFGMPQFMPGTYRRFALDYDGDGLRDLRTSPGDAIGSVANFLKGHGWEAGQPIAARARVTGEAYRKLVDAGIKPVYRISDLPSYGVTTTADLPVEAGCALLELETPGQDSEYWIGLQNFYALTRYNRSSFYAISVFELAREIASANP